jgi:hypothetical protein
MAYSPLGDPDIEAAVARSRKRQQAAGAFREKEKRGKSRPSSGLKIPGW